MNRTISDETPTADIVLLAASKIGKVVSPQQITKITAYLTETQWYCNVSDLRAALANECQWNSLDIPGRLKVSLQTVLEEYENNIHDCSYSDPLSINSEIPIAATAFSDTSLAQVEYSSTNGEENLNNIMISHDYNYQVPYPENSELELQNTSYPSEIITSTTTDFVSYDESAINYGQCDLYQAPTENYVTEDYEARALNLENVDNDNYYTTEQYPLNTALECQNNIYNYSGAEITCSNTNIESEHQHPLFQLLDDNEYEQNNEDMFDNGYYDSIGSSWVCKVCLFDQNSLNESFCSVCCEHSSLDPLGEDFAGICDARSLEKLKELNAPSAPIQFIASETNHFQDKPEKCNRILYPSLVDHAFRYDKSDENKALQESGTSKNESVQSNGMSKISSNGKTQERLFKRKFRFPWQEKYKSHIDKSSTSSNFKAIAFSKAHDSNISDTEKKFQALAFNNGEKKVLVAYVDR